MWTFEIPDKNYDLQTRVGVEMFEEFQETLKLLNSFISSELETNARGLQVSVCSMLRNVSKIPNGNRE